MADNGTWVSASGTLAGDDVPKINHTHINCVRANGTCEMIYASFDPEASFLHLYYPGLDIYAIKVWTKHMVIAIDEGPCSVASLTIDVLAQTVTRSHTGSCVAKSPSTWTLTDGMAVTWKIYQEGHNKARELVYKPARKLVPPVPSWGQDSGVRIPVPE
jgi:hypothetical protein